MKTGNELLEGNNIRVFVVDRNKAWCEALSKLIQRQPGMDIVGKSTTRQEAIRNFRFLKPDVLLIDIQRSTNSERECIFNLKRDYPELSIVVHSHNRYAAIADLMDMEHLFYLPKGSPPRIILQTIQNACRHPIANISAVL